MLSADPAGTNTSSQPPSKFHPTVLQQPKRS
jgi:hypothetical protein